MEQDYTLHILVSKLHEILPTSQSVSLTYSSTSISTFAQFLVYITH